MPLLSSQDPFFRPPADLAAIAPGTIVRHRPVDIAVFGVVPQQVSAWQLLYRSNDLHGRPEATATTVLLPTDADLDVQRPLLAFQSAVDAVTERCAPSYALRCGARALGSITQIEWLLMIAPALRRGWAVSIADHEGPQGNFGAPREPGYRCLDGIRAALRFQPLGLHADSPVAVWGYSGGGMASSWLVETAPTYAPELDIVGAVLGAPVGDPGQVFLRLNGGLFAGFPAMVIAAMRHIYPALDRLLETHLTPAGYPLLATAERLPPLLTLVRLANHDVDRYLDRPLADILTEPELQFMLDDLRLGGSTPTCPLLVVQPVHDQVIHAEGVDGLVDRYRHGGTHVTYLRDRLSEHFSLLALATPVSLDWLADRLAARPVPPSETRTVWSIAASRSAGRGYLFMASTVLRALFGRPLSRTPIPALRPPHPIAA